YPVVGYPMRLARRASPSSCSSAPTSLPPRARYWWPSAHRCVRSSPPVPRDLPRSPIVGTVLSYLVVTVVVATVVFLTASLVFGRGEELAALPPDATPTGLPEGPLAGDDVRAVRFSQVLRGYRMSEVDWTLRRAAAELDALRARIAELEEQR